MGDLRDNPNPDGSKPGLSERDALIERELDRRLSAANYAPSVEVDGAALKLQDDIDASLKRSFAAPAPPEELLARLTTAPTVAKPTTTTAEEHAVEVAPAPSPTAAKRSRWSVGRLATAASLLLAVGLWSFYGDDLILRLTNPKPDYSQRNILLVYNDAVAGGFKPDWFCDDEKLFADTFYERQGEGVWLEPLPEGVRMVGLAYLDGLAPNATSMLAMVDGKEVLVVVARDGKIPPELLVPRKGAPEQVFQQQLGDLLVVEVTPLDKPRVAGSLYLAAPPAEPTGRVPGEG